MIGKLKLGLVIFLLTIPVFAQHTTVTATVKDPLNAIYRTCTGSANFTGQNTTPGAGPYLLGGSVFQTVVPISCDSKGQFLVSLADNLQITPTPSQWSFSLCTAIGIFPGPPICFTTLITITGTAQDITAQLQAASATLPPYTVILETNGVPNGSQALLNLIAGSNITITDDGHGNVTIASSGGGGGGGGGGGLPDPGSNGLVARVGLNATAAVPNVAIGSYYVSAGTGTQPITQKKAIYDTRDWMTCDGNGTTGTDASTGLATLLSTIGTSDATIRWIGTTTSTASCRVGNFFTGSNITNDFSGGGSVQLISSSTVIGGGAYVSGTSVECGSGSTCALPAFSVSAGNTLLVAEAPYPGFTFLTTSVTDTCGNFYIHAFQSLAGQPRNQGLWVASNATGGTCTITATANGSLTTHMMLVAQISGMGPVVSVDASASNNNTGTTMSSGSVTTLTGAFLFAFGGQPFTAETCTAGAGYTQPASIAGQSSPNGSLCAEYKNASAGGSTSATQTISANPSPGTWVYSLVSLKPGNATATIWGGIVNPDQHKIFYNADSQTGHGVVDFTGSPITQDVYPEWWGASGTASAAINTPAMQAAFYAAYGGGLTQRRTNGSGLSIYNRPLHIGALYQINDELKMYSTNGFQMHGVNRLSSGFVQTGTNKRIIDGQSNTYGVIDNLQFSTAATQNAALVDFDWNGIATPGDLKPQFIDLNHVNFIGNGIGFIGLEIAKSGGAAQGSNIYCRDCAFQSFTEACVQVGTHAAGATNALAIGISGDIQGCSKNGIAVYGGGYVSFGAGVEESSMENASQGFATQTGFDMYCEATQGPCSMDYMRSESRRLISGNDIVLHKSRMINQASLVTAGTTNPVGSLMTGTVVGGDGAFYTVTNNSSAFGGIGSASAPLHASSGTGTTLVDTNQTVAGSVTIGALNVASELMTQAVTGSTGTIIVRPSSIGTITGTWGGVAFTFGETITQTVTGVTCVETAYSGLDPSIKFNCNNFSGTADNTHVWTGGTSGSTFTPSTVPSFTAVTMVITAATGAPDNSHDWVGGTSAAHFTPTAVPVNEANFTVNAFTGMLASTLAGKNAGCYGTVTSNTATTITFTAGWTTRYMKLGCPSPDTSSTFVVEPGWNHGTVTSGGMTMVYLDENAIDCQTSFGSKGSCNPQGRLEDVIVAGGKIQANSPNLTMRNVQLYRQDWYAGNNIQGTGDIFPDWDVHIISTVSPGVVPYQGTFYQGWSLPSTAGVSYTGANQWRLGTKAIVWDTGTVGTSNPPANTSANSVWIGGRVDSGAGTDATRNVLEFGGMLGRASPLPSAANSFSITDAAGTDTDITGGPSTGAGPGGAINFYTSVPSGSSSTVNSGAKRWLVSTAGHWFAGLDNTYDVGATAANRPRTVYAGTSLITPVVTASGTNGGFSGTEGTGASVPAGASLDVMWPDSTAHRWKMNNNNEATNENLAGTLPSGTVTTAGTIINAGTCQAQTGITITGALTTDNVVANIGAVLPATWQTGIVLSAHVTAGNTVTVYLCNPSAGGITPAATQVTVRIIR